MPGFFTVIIGTIPPLGSGHGEFGERVNQALSLGGVLQGGIFITETKAPPRDDPVVFEGHVHPPSESVKTGHIGVLYPEGIHERFQALRRRMEAGEDLNEIAVRQGMARAVNRKSRRNRRA
jgi:hypothetical protein